MMSVQALNVYWRFLSESSVLGVVSDAYLPLFQHLFPGWVFKKYSEAETPSATDKLSASTIIDFRSDEFSETLLKEVAAYQKLYFDFSGETFSLTIQYQGSS